MRLSGAWRRAKPWLKRLVTIALTVGIFVWMLKPIARTGQPCGTGSWRPAAGSSSWPRRCSRSSCSSSARRRGGGSSGLRLPRARRRRHARLVDVGTGALPPRRHLAGDGAHLPDQALRHPRQRLHDEPDPGTGDLPAGQHDARRLLPGLARRPPPRPGGQAWLFGAMALVPVLAFLLHPKVLYGMINADDAKLGKPADQRPNGIPDLTGLLVWTVLGLLWQSLAIWFLVHEPLGSADREVVGGGRRVLPGMDGRVPVDLLAGRSRRARAGVHGGDALALPPHAVRADRRQRGASRVCSHS